nr:hypothetical protein [Bacteroidota bacterium]
MLLKKNFRHPGINYFEVSRFRFIAGIAIGLLYAFGFYSLFYVSREVFRMLSITEFYELWTLTDSEVNFYNLFFAYISTILGQSYCFSFWIDRPKKFFNTFYYRKSSIVNDQRVLNWFFLSWFSKIALIFGIWFGYSIRGGYYVFSFYPDYKFLFILAIIVLFLQTWTTIRLTFKNKSFKWFIISAVVVSMVSFGMSRINLIDYNALNNSITSRNIHHNYSLDLPYSDVYGRSEMRSLIINIYLVKPKDFTAESQPIIVINSQEIPLEGFRQKINNILLSKHEADRRFIVYRFHIHKDIEMSFVNKVKYELSSNGPARVAYAVIPDNAEYDPRFYTWFSFYIRIPALGNERFNIREMYDYFHKNGSILKINQIDDEQCLVNDSVVDIENIKDVLRRAILQNPDYSIEFFVNGKVKFSSYFKILSGSRKAVNELRDDYSFRKFSLKYNELISEDAIEEVQKKYPFRLYELTDDLMKVLSGKN